MPPFRGRHVRMGDVMDSYDLPDKISHLVKGGAVDEAVVFVENHWDTLSALHAGQLFAALKSLPSWALLENPRLMIAAMQLQNSVLGQHLDQPDGHSPASENDRPGALLTRLTRLTTSAHAARMRGRPDEAARIAKSARAALEAASAADVRALRSVLPTMKLDWGRSLDAADRDEARVEYRRAFDLAHASSQTGIASRAAAYAAWLHVERGRLDIAEEWIARARGESAQAEHLAALHLAEAVISTDRNDLDHAQASLEKAETSGLGEYRAAALWVRSLHAHDVATAAVTESLIANYEQEHPGTLVSHGFDGRLLRAARVRVRALRGRVDRDLETYVDHSVSDRVIAAAIAHFAGHDRRAFDLSLPATEESVEPRLQSNALLVNAAAANALGYDKTATHAFLRADALIQEHRLFSTYECIAAAELDQLVHRSGAESRETLRIHSARRDLPGLSPRENDVLALLATDLSVDEIAEKLFISRNTLKTLTRRLYRKLGVSSRRAAVDHAQRSGLQQ
jgi:ATP/maltotriose-dependent transcriptional regulator MalT